MDLARVWHDVALVLTLDEMLCSSSLDVSGTRDLQKMDIVVLKWFVDPIILNIQLVATG
jgi:hypothetical protein